MKQRTHRLIVFVIDPVVDFVLVVCSVALAYYIYGSLNIGKSVYYYPDLVALGAVIFSIIVVAILLIFGRYNEQSSLLNILLTLLSTKRIGAYHGLHRNNL